MPRDVKKILEDDARKPTAPGVEEPDDILIDDEGGHVVDDDVAAKPAADDKGKGKAKPSSDDEATKLRAELKKAQDRAAAEAIRADEAEKRAGAEATKVKSAYEQQIVARDNEIDSKIATAKTSLESIKQQLKQARATNDTDAEVELQDAMTDARYALNAADWEKKNFTTWKENQKKIAEQQPARQDNDASPYTAKERRWIADHPEFNSNKRFARIAKAAAGQARDEENLPQDSAAYFEFIENALKEEGFLADDDDPTSGAGDNAPRKVSTSTGAAPQKSGSSTPPVGKNAKYPNIPSGYRIPPDWVAAAEEQGFEGREGLLEYTNMRLEEEAKGTPQR